MVAGIVFRRLGGPAELVGVAGYRSSRLSGGEAWSGLSDLTADDGAALIAVAATVRLSPQVVELRAFAAAPFDGYARLLRELADDCRATGAEWLIAADAPGADRLRLAGLDALPDRAGWLALAI